MAEEEERIERSDRLLINEDFAVGSLPTVIYIPNFITESEQFRLLHNIYEVPASRWKSLTKRRLQNWGGVVHEKGLLPQALPPWLTMITERINRQSGLFPAPINHVLINEYLPDQGIMPHQDGSAYFPVVAILSLQAPLVIDFTPHSRLEKSTLLEKNELPVVSDTVKAERDTLPVQLTSVPVTEHQPFSVLLMPCSLLIFKDQAYTEYLHGIQGSELHSLDKVINISEALNLKEAELISSLGESGMQQPNTLLRTSTRISLTCRLVLKVHKNLFKF